ncbi:hypothetical protein GCM10010495_49550 [Kitasatospora herbaricolor]|nr:hypothetical protein GCM10010495_49550 [Kitasatospora herbaricolor]
MERGTAQDSGAFQRDFAAGADRFRWSTGPGRLRAAGPTGGAPRPADRTREIRPCAPAVPRSRPPDARNADRFTPPPGATRAARGPARCTRERRNRMIGHE